MYLCKTKYRKDSTADSCRKDDAEDPANITVINGSFTDR